MDPWEGRVLLAQDQPTSGLGCPRAAVWVSSGDLGLMLMGPPRVTANTKLVRLAVSLSARWGRRERKVGAKTLAKEPGRVTQSDAGKKVYKLY